MARMKRTQLNDPDAISSDAAHYMGRGYFIPSSTNAREVQALFDKWNQLLQKEGHVDIEHYSALSPGKVSPRLRHTTQLNPDNEGSAYNVALVDAYLTNYLEHTRLQSRKVRKYYAIDVFLLKCYSAGVDLGSLVRLFKAPTTESVRIFFSKYNIEGCRPALIHNNTGRSKYWLFTRTNTALAYCYAWHLTDINGELTPELVNMFLFRGLDSKRALGVINKARRKAGLELIKLKWPTLNY